MTLPDDIAAIVEDRIRAKYARAWDYWSDAVKSTIAEIVTYRDAGAHISADATADVIKVRHGITTNGTTIDRYCRHVLGRHSLATKERSTP
jgi:hypothetical protein